MIYELRLDEFFFISPQSHNVHTDSWADVSEKRILELGCFPTTTDMEDMFVANAYVD